MIIPTYNEVKNIGMLLKQLRALLPKAILIVVDGHSQDKTVVEVKQLIKKDKQIIIFEQKHKQGRGHAVLLGISQALKFGQVRYLVEMDADLSHQVSDLPKLLSPCSNKTVVIASRYIKGAKIVNWPKWRLQQSRLANRLISYVLGLGLKDNTNGFRCYSRQAAKTLVKHHYLSRGFMTLSEMAYVLINNGFMLKEIPSTFVDRRFGKSSAGYKELFMSLVNLIQIRLYSYFC